MTFSYLFILVYANLEMVFIVFAHEVCGVSVRDLDERWIFYLGACTKGKYLPFILKGLTYPQMGGECHAAQRFIINSTAACGS